MKRLFHAALLTLIAALAAALWTRQIGPIPRLGSFFARQAQAQAVVSPSSAPLSPAIESRPSPLTPRSSLVAPRPSDPDSGEEVAAIELESTKVVATVGDDVILAGDVMGTVNMEMSRRASQVKPEQLEQLQAILFQQVLKGLVESRLMLIEARRKIPEEHFPQVVKKVEDGFVKDELPKMMKRMGAPTRSALDSILRQSGSSLEREQRVFVDRTLAQTWVGQQIDRDSEITHQEMLTYYQEHLADFEYESQARWEQLMVRFSSYRTRQEAWAALADMGNQIQNGAPWSDVAKARSDGPTASDGGIHDWTTQGSLVSTTLDQAIFALPVGALSRPLTDEKGFHIVRVIERKQAGRVSFPDAQAEIKKKIRTIRINDQIKEYLAKLRREIPVWTILDGAPNPAGAGVATATPPLSR